MSPLARRLLLSTGAVTVLTVLAFGSTPSEEDLARMEAEKQERAVAGDAWRAKLGAVHTKLAGVDDAFISTKTACDGKAMRAKIDTAFDGADTIMSFSGLRVVYHPFLERFAKDDAAAYKADVGEFAWMTDDTFTGHFTEHPSERASYAADDTNERIAESFAPETYLAVVVPHPDLGSEMGMPDEGDEEAFEGGLFIGSVAIVEVETGEIACQGTVAVESSEVVEWQEGGRGLNSLKNETFAEALRADFEDNFEDAVGKVVPSELGVSTSYGHIFR